jgi:pimeloyl-ACP methyl ester carboxylesterase
VEEIMKVYKSKKAKANILRSYDQLIELWGVSYEDIWIENDYGKTHIITCGNKSGEPLVLFHGVGDNSALMWIYNAKALGQHYRLYAIDTMGGPGKSEPGIGYNKSFHDIDWIDSILNGLGLDKVHIAGTSHGGYLVMYYLLKRPERVMKAIGMASAISNDNRNPMYTMMKIFLPEALFPTKGNVLKLIKKLSGEHHQVFTENPVIMEHYASLLKGFNNMAMAYHKVVPFTKEEVSKIGEGIYLLLGRRDPFEKLGGEEAVKSRKLNAMFFEEAGHGINHEEASEINRIIIKILKGEVEDIRNYNT